MFLPKINPTAKLIRESNDEYNKNLKLLCFSFYTLKKYKKEKTTNLLIKLFTDTDETNIQEVFNLNMIYQQKKKFMKKEM